ncbi:MAG: macrolide family glycosyltransferase [Acidobacteriota bacterium]
MAKALFLSLPLHGHTNPSLPLVRELARRGEEIVYYSTDAFAAKIEQAGARYQPYRNAFLKDMRDIPDRMEQLGWLLMRTTGEVLGQELDAFRAERPDYVISDSVAPWGRCVATVLGVPLVTSVPTFAFNRRVAAFAFAHGVRPKSARLVVSKLRHTINALRLGRRLRRLHGVSPGLKNLLFSYSDLNIVYTSRYFQPCADTFDDRFQFVGPSMTPRTETTHFPWEQVRHPVIVYVSLGTLFNTDATFYRNCFEAFRADNFQVVLSFGENVSAEALGPAPPNFIVQAYVPQLEVLGRAAVFVTHGGMNSVSESLGRGVPVVVVPQMSEQAIVGRRVEELGAGLYLAKEEVTAEKLRESVQRILAEDRFRRQAALVRESFEAAGGIARAADAIQVASGKGQEYK